MNKGFKFPTSANDSVSSPTAQTAVQAGPPPVTKMDSPPTSTSPRSNQSPTPIEKDRVPSRGPKATQSGESEGDDDEVGETVEVDLS